MTDRPVAGRAVERAGIFLDGAPDPIIVADADGTIEFFNRRAQEVFECTAGDIIGQNVDVLIPGRMRKSHGQLRAGFAVKPRIRSMASENSRVMAVTAGGREFPVEVSLSPITVDGRLLVMAAIRDITQRLESEERLRRSEQSFRAAFDEAPVAMIMIDLNSADHSMVQTNKTFGRLVGLDPTELVNRELSDVLDESDLATMTKLIKGGPSASTEVQLRRSDGSYRCVWAHSADISTAESRCALLHLVDITRRVEAEHDRDHREHFLVALGAIRSEILTERTSAVVLDLITHYCTELWEDSTSVVATSNGRGEIEARAVRGCLDQVVEGQILDTEATAIGAALRTRSTVGIEEPPGEANATAGTTTVIAPFTGMARVEGALMVTTALGAPAEPSMVEALAREAAMSIELEHAVQERRRLLVTTDRERIARDLHDLVIQRLFAAGMRLQSAIGSPDDIDGCAREVIHELDETITEIRNTIFKLTEPDTTLSAQLHAMLDTFVAPFDTTLSTSVTGDLDKVPDDVATHLLATINEAVSNSLRHAAASTISLSVSVHQDLTLRVADDGVGIGHLSSSGRGLANMADRAAAVGGELTINSPVTGGTELIWTAPMGAD